MSFVPLSVPLKFTVLLPCDEPKFVPVSVIEVPRAPDVGEQAGNAWSGDNSEAFAIAGSAGNRNDNVARRRTSRHRSHDALVAVQFVTVAVLPLNLTVLVPWDDPKPVPVIVTDAPTAPDVGDRLVILGAATA